MSLHKSPEHGIVEAMTPARHHERELALGHALERLSVARAERGPVGVFDPLEIVGEQARLDAAVPTRKRDRAGLFRFRERGQRALVGSESLILGDE